jgi:polyisoprenoid-binding protein YceI
MCADPDESTGATLEKMNKSAFSITTYLGMKPMFKKMKTLFAVLVIIICGAANAEYESIVNGVEQEHAMPGMEMILNGNVYEIVADTAKMEFRVDSPIGDVWASFRDFEGRFLMLNSGRDHALASIDINAESLDTDGGLIRAMLKSERFFDVENFPSMSFVGSSFEWYSDRRAVLKGYMTIKNITRQVAFYVELVDADVDNGYSDSVTVVASTTIRRSAFGIDSLLPAVSDNVNLFMSIDARKKAISISSM